MKHDRQSASSQVADLICAVITGPFIAVGVIAVGGLLVREMVFLLRWMGGLW